MNLVATRYKYSKNLNKAKTRKYRLMRANLMLSLMKSIFFQQLSNRFKRYKPVDLSKAKITVILSDLARGRTIQL
jgi:hypothetical protein